MEDERSKIEEILELLREKCVKVKTLLEVDSKTDPVTQPFLSKYKAKKILLEMCAIIDNTECETSNILLSAMLGSVLLQTGVIEMDTEEFSNCEKSLTKAETVLTPYAINPEVVLTLINVYNNLGILWSNRDDHPKAKKYLQMAKELYGNFKSTMRSPVLINCLLGGPKSDEHNPLDCILMLEKCYTLTLYYLAQVYGSLKLELKSAIYCHVTLKRQQQYDDYDPIEWALNSATLSQFFAAQNGFPQARHHLAASTVILERYEKKLHESPSDDDEYLAKLETLRHRSADVALCWVKYCLNLMTTSKTRLTGGEGYAVADITDLSSILIVDEDICDNNINNLKFEALDVSAVEETVTGQYLLMYGDAREVFLACLNWINKAKEYYSLESLASDYIKIIQDHSQALHLLAFFEDDYERRAKMQKRRVNLIEDLLKEINPKYYLEYCRQLWFELGEVYTEILNIKLEKASESDATPTPHALNKINMLCDKSIENYEEFLKSMKDPKTGRIIPLEDEVIRPVVNAYAYVGRNLMKKVAPDINLKRANINKSYEAYKAAVAVCERDDKTRAMMSAELALCKEMMTILPIRLQRLEDPFASLLNRYV